MSIVIPEGLVRLAEVAKRLCVSTQTLLRWIKRGRMRAYRVPGGGYRVAWPDALAALRVMGGDGREEKSMPQTARQREAALALEEIHRQRALERQKRKAGRKG